MSLTPDELIDAKSNEGGSASLALLFKRTWTLEAGGQWVTWRVLWIDELGRQANRSFERWGDAVQFRQWLIDGDEQARMRHERL